MFRYEVDKYLHWDPQFKRFSPQWWRSDQQPFYLYMDPNTSANPKVINAFGGATTPDGVFVQKYSSNQGADNFLGNPIQVRSIQYADSGAGQGTAVANWTVRLRDAGDQRELMNQPLHIRTFAGTAQQPAILREPLLIVSSSWVTAQFAKVAGAATAGRLYLTGCQYFPWSPDLQAFPAAKAHMEKVVGKWMERTRYIHPYWLTGNANPYTVPLNGALRDVVRVAEDSQFEIFTLASLANADYGLEITNVTNGQMLMNGVVTATNAVGSNLFPTILPVPFLIPGGHKLAFRLSDIGGAGPITVWLSLQGRKIYAPLKNVSQVLKDTEIRMDEDMATPADQVQQFELTPYI